MIDIGSIRYALREAIRDTCEFAQGFRETGGFTIDGKTRHIEPTFCEFIEIKVKNLEFSENYGIKEFSSVQRTTIEPDFQAVELLFGQYALQTKHLQQVINLSKEFPCGTTKSNNIIEIFVSKFVREIILFKESREVLDSLVENCLAGLYALESTYGATAFMYGMKLGDIPFSMSMRGVKILVRRVVASDFETKLRSSEYISYALSAPSKKHFPLSKLELSYTASSGNRTEELMLRTIAVLRGCLKSSVKHQCGRKAFRILG